MPFSSLIILSSLNGSSGFRLDGTASGDQAGISVASAGDVNGDGYADLIVGAQYAGGDVGRYSTVGSSYIIFGQPGGWDANIKLSSLVGSNGFRFGNNGFRLDGITQSEYSGHSVASAGDVNGDGYADLIIGANAATGGNGRAYLVFGKPSGWTSAINLSTLDGSNGFKLSGGYQEALGASVASAGDVNGDGYADFIIGANLAGDFSHAHAGTSYVVFGKSTGWNPAFDLSSLNGSNGFKLLGVSAGDYSGWSVSSAGDVNGDGFADIIIGSLYHAASYVVFGRASGFASAIELSALDGNTGFRLSDDFAYSSFGASVASAGDVNGDGFGDLIIGASGEGLDASNNYTYTGNSYVVFGKSGGWNSTLNVSSLNGSNGFRLDGIIREQSGKSVASAGDVNGDGFADIMIGSPLADLPGNTDAGWSRVIFGKASGWASAIDLASLDGSNGFKLNGVAFSDYSGSALASAGDVDGDGFPDLIIGANSARPDAPSNYAATGAAYVYFSPATGGALYRGTTLADTILGTPDADTMNGYGQNDKLNGNAGDDTINGGTGNDSINGGAGNDSIDGGTGTDLALLSGPQSAYRIGIRDNILITNGPDGQDQYANIEAFQWGNNAAISLATLQASSATTGLLYAALAGKSAAYILPDLYTGPVPGLTNQLLATATNDVISGTTGNDFINALAGDDAVDGGAGNDVIDGGLGSNFLTGGAGLDIFFLDGRGAATANSWATITDFSPGEQVTIWGYKPGISRFLWVASDGAVGFKGATLHADLDGNGQTDTSLTFSGLTQAQLPTQSFGTVGGYDYVLFA
jgi:Ca2+-binding RTX toxin-like protein